MTAEATPATSPSRARARGPWAGSGSWGDIRAWTERRHHGRIPLAVVDITQGVVAPQEVEEEREHVGLPQEQ